MIEQASDEADEKIEPHPLWEYPAKALSSPQKLSSFDLDGQIPKKSIFETGDIKLNGNGTLNGMALWVNWHFSEDAEDCITTGPTKTVAVNEEVIFVCIFIFFDD